MNKTWFCLILVLLSVTSTFSQNISKTWTLDEEVSSNQETFAEGNTLNLNEGLLVLARLKILWQKEITSFRIIFLYSFTTILKIVS